MNNTDFFKDFFHFSESFFGDEYILFLKVYYFFELLEIVTFPTLKRSEKIESVTKNNSKK